MVSRDTFAYMLNGNCVALQYENVPHATYDFMTIASVRYCVANTEMRHKFIPMIVKSCRMFTMLVFLCDFGGMRREGSI